MQNSKCKIAIQNSKLYNFIKLNNKAIITIAKKRFAG